MNGRSERTHSFQGKAPHRIYNQKFHKLEQPPLHKAKLKSKVVSASIYYSHGHWQHGSLFEGPKAEQRDAHICWARSRHLNHNQASLHILSICTFFILHILLQYFNLAVVTKQFPMSVIIEAIQQWQRWIHHSYLRGNPIWMAVSRKSDFLIDCRLLLI